MLQDQEFSLGAQPKDSSFLGRKLNTGKTLPRSLSFTTLFTEDEVTEVTCPPVTPPSQSKIHFDLLSTTSSMKAEAAMVHVYDAVVSKDFNIRMSAQTTFEALKTRIQQAQVESGVRLLPVHMQKLTIGGIEWADDCCVSDALEQQSRCCRVVVMEPKVPELISFFLSSICDLRFPSVHNVVQDDCPPTNTEHTCMFGEMDDLGIEDLAASCEDTNIPTSTSTALHSPCLSPCATAGLSPCVLSPCSKSLEVHGVLAGLELALEALSAQATPSSSSEAMKKYLSPSYTAKSFDEREALAMLFDSSSSPRWGEVDGGGEVSAFDRSEMSSFHRSEMSSFDRSSLRWGFDGGEQSSLRALLLRDVCVPEEVYRSQLHLLVRNIEQARPFLQRFKWGSLAEMVLQVQSGLRHGHSPQGQQQQQLTDPSSRFDYGELVAHCCGGTYIMSDCSGSPCAIFKPADEEPYGPENPKGYSGSMGVESAMKPGISVGGGAARECAAYLLDHEGKAGVPCTGMVHVTHSTLLRAEKAEVQIKSGSLQRFVEHDCTAEDVGTSGFDLNQVHAIGIFDVRTFNMDRNSDNILVVRGRGGDKSVSLVPIDHGYILPSFKHLEDVNCCWLFWPQAKVPYSTTTLAMVAALDPLADAAMLRSTLALPDDTLATLVIGTLLIKAAAAAGMTLYQTGMLTVRGSPDRPSPLEQAVADAVVGSGGGGDGGLCSGGGGNGGDGDGDGSDGRESFSRPGDVLGSLDPRRLMEAAAGIVGGGAGYAAMERAVGELVARAAEAQRVGQAFHGLARNIARRNSMVLHVDSSSDSD